MAHELTEKITKNFTFKELCYSDTAKTKKIDNFNPTDKQFENIKSLCENLLQPIRDKIGKPITVNSCYRCTTLNATVGGKPTSQHLANNGAAADIEIMGMSNYDFCQWIIDNKFDFDQLILEYANNLDHDINSGWVHVSYNKGKNRHQVLTINKKGTFVGLVK